MTKVGLSPSSAREYIERDEADLDSQDSASGDGGHKSITEE
jgi:hypothetical protein